METMGKVAVTIVVALVLRWGWKLLNWVWLKPKKLEKWLRDEGYKGNSYRFPLGDLIELASMIKEGKTKHIPVTHDITSYALPFDHYIISKFGKKSVTWFGPKPRIYIRDPELIKEILLRPNDFQKLHPDPFLDNIIRGLIATEGHKWAKHRKIINPAFNLQNLKIMFSAIRSSCGDMIHEWEHLTATTGSIEVDVWPHIDSLAGDMISRAAFGSCYEDGRKIFDIHKEQLDLALQMLSILYIPGRRFIPTKANKKFNENVNELRSILMAIINKRKKLEIIEGKCDDLLGILLESNKKEIEEHGVGMSMEDVIEECNLFYIAGSETTANLIVWTMVCLSLHQDWQMRARDEVLHVFGKGEVDFEGLKNLKIITMILNEVLRLYSPVSMTTRATHKETKLGSKMIPSGVLLSLPVMHVHHDPEIWGDDVHEFKPERFSEGILNATKEGKGSSAFFPFSSGPRICIGHNLAITEAKTAMAMVLQHFSFELSPSYKHSPFALIALPPRFGAHLILRKI
ncbi:hypothetical protein E3N88_37641 [Mikania micrantha]|uniref:Cytochrome P450 n=1 Tax=Mikania micrantha TaxID=192012 RepID=A0A5N6LRP1_9ASTR|nr:hypothetical protein E3N88_37641 [Mikania micrantha]